MKVVSKLIKLAVLGCLATPLATTANSNYQYESVSYPGSTDTQLWGITTKGEAIGTWGNSDTQARGAFFYDADTGGITDYQAPAGFESFTVFDSNKNGDVVGSAIDLDTGRAVGLYVGSNGDVISFEHPDSAGFTQPRGLNDKGLIAGFYNDAVNTNPVSLLTRTAFTYDINTQEFTSFLPSALTIAQGVNNNGDVVGNVIFLQQEENVCNVERFFERFGFIRNSSGEMTFFQINEGNSSARDINDKGQIVGFTNDILEDGSQDNQTKSFVIAQPQSQCSSVAVASEDYIVPPQAEGGATFAQAIDANGTISGQYRFDTGEFDELGRPIFNTFGFIATTDTKPKKPKKPKK